MNPGQLLIVGIKGPTLSHWEKKLFTDIQPGGFILFSRNLESPAQIRNLTDSLRELSLDPPLIAIDQEGGRVWRTREFSAAPPDAQTFAHKATFQQISYFGAYTGRLLELLGINFNLAPVLDLDHFPTEKNGLRGRCWGQDSQNVIDKAGLFNRWMRKQYILGCGKHFPTNGLAKSDPHHELPCAHCTIEELLRDDLIPYTALMPELDAILACHLHFPNIDPELPASLSKKILTNLLRNQLGYEGLILTDDLDMGAIVNHYGRGNDVRLAIEAGADLALICHQTETIPDALKSLENIPLGQIDDSAKRIEKAKKNLRPPTPFSIAKWDNINQDLTNLTREIIGQDRFDPEAPILSPVEDY